MRQLATKILGLIFIIAFSSAVAQVNLVNNPSFEFRTDNNPPYFTSKHYYWKGLDSTNAFAGGTYLSTSVGNAPVTGVGYCQPHSGTSFVRTTLHCTPATCGYYQSRFYQKNTLRDTLVAGTTYCVKIWVSMQDLCPYAIKDLQFYLSDSSVDTIKYCMGPVTFLTPQITNTLGIIGDTLNWTQIKGTYTATGNETRLVFGCFLPDAAITRTVTGYTTGDWSEYFIDDVSIIDFNLPAQAGPDKNINLGDSAFVGQPPEVGLECTWTSGTFTVGTGGGLWIKPTIAGTFSYVVTQNICGNIKTDTVNVNVLPTLISEHTLYSQSINLFPQPANDHVKLTFRNYSEETVSFEIMDTNGKTVYFKVESLKSNSTIIPTENLADGIYYLKIKNSKDQFATKKLTVTH